MLDRFDRVASLVLVMAKSKRQGLAFSFKDCLLVASFSWIFSVQETTLGALLQSRARQSCLGLAGIEKVRTCFPYLHASTSPVLAAGS